MNAQEQRLFGHWDELKGKIKEHWGQITDDELAEVEGQYDQLVGLIQQKTGEARVQIKRYIDQLGDNYSDALADATGAAREYVAQARDYVDHANEAIQETADQVRRRAREGYEQAHEVVRRRPAESVAVAFGTGLLVGVIVGLIARTRD